jgi:hypothetical protein
MTSPIELKILIYTERNGEPMARVSRGGKENYLYLRHNFKPITQAVDQALCEVVEDHAANMKKNERPEVGEYWMIRFGVNEPVCARLLDTFNVKHPQWVWYGGEWPANSDAVEVLEKVDPDDVEFKRVNQKGLHHG